VALIGDRARLALAWAGVATFAILGLLASAHLALDLVAVVRGSGVTIDLLARLGPPAALGLAALALLVAVVSLASSHGTRRVAGIVLAFLVLVGVRLVIAALFDGVTDGEPREYDELAEGVLAGACCMADRPMGYPIILAGAYATGVDRQVAVEAVNLLFAIVAGAAVLGIGRALYGWRIGAAALVAYAVWPAGALMVDVRLPQTTYDALVAGAVWVAVALPAGWRGSALVGILLGLAQYMRPSTLALLPALALARTWEGGPWRRLVGASLVPLGLAFLLVLGPAIWHNIATYGEVSVSTSTFGGHSLYIGTDQRTGGRFSGAANEELIALAGPEPHERSVVGARIAMDRIRSDPLGIAWLAIVKQDTLWATERYGVEYGIDRGLRERPANPRATTPLLMSQAFLAVVYLAAAAALFLRRRELDALGALAVVLVWSVALAHALLEVRDRHHAYVIPVLLPLAAVAVVALIDAAASALGRRRQARGRGSGPEAAAAA
jgi:hypothetical protein